MAEAYADIHHYSKVDESQMDEDGDPLFGWYYQIMESPSQPSTGLVGPYHERSECEKAALKEWEGMPS